MDKVKEKKVRRTVHVRLDAEPALPVEAVKPKEVEKPVEKQEAPRIIREYYTTIREVPKFISMPKPVRRRAAPKKRKAKKPKK